MSGWIWRSLFVSARRAGGRLLARAGALVLLAAGLALPARAQAVTWERLPVVAYFPTDVDPISAVDFLYGEGPLATDPAADSLVVFSLRGAFLYNPSGAAGAAGSNGDWGAWHNLCGACAAADGLVTAAGSVVIGTPSGATQLSRGTDRGRRWTYNFDRISAFPFFESMLPALAGPDGTPALFAGVGDDGRTSRSLGDGAPGTWVRVGTGYGYPEVFGEVLPSAALPQGRLLIGVWGGIRYSDDGGTTYTLASGPGMAGYIVHSFTFAPDPAHPFGGVAYSGVQDTVHGEADGASVYRSDDGGATWSLAHLFTAKETGQPPVDGASVAEVQVLATADGALWAGVGLSVGGAPRGGIMRSVDGGASWARADAGFAAADSRGWKVNALAVSRAGVLYAATVRGVWRTTGAVVAGEAGPAEASGLGVTVRPNPAGARVEVRLTLAEAASTVRVVVVDALGREVAVVLDGAVAAGESVAALDTSGWPAGVYVVRAAVGGQTAAARLVVAR